MSDNQELYSYLFAVRISLQDAYENESDIIRELKLYLLETGHGSSSVNQILHGFYQNYGIDISIETISQVPITNNNMLNNMLGFLLNQDDFDNSGDIDDQDDESPVDDESVHEHQEDESNEDDDEEDPPQHISSLANALMNQIPNMNSNNNHQTMNNPFNVLPPNMIFQFSSNGQTFTFNSSGQNIPQTNNPFLNNVNNQGTSHQNMVNLLNAFMQGLNNQPAFNINPNNLFQDVVVSTDENDLDKLKTTTLETKLDCDCSICMGSMDKDETVTELNCSHTFHKDCIFPYLKQYNYKCPVCRAEVGKTKYNM
jgi:hypothetical protein